MSEELFFTAEDFLKKDPGPSSSGGKVNLFIFEDPVNNGKYFAEGMTIQIVDKEDKRLLQILSQARTVVFEYFDFEDPDKNRPYIATIEIRQKIKGSTQEYFYLKFLEDIRVGLKEDGSGDPALLQERNIFFEPSVEFKFANSDFDTLRGTVSAVRRSKNRLKVDNQTVNEQGLPGNIKTLIKAGRNKELKDALPKRLFGEVQDSLYSDAGWTNARYNGSEFTRIRTTLGDTQECRTLGSEPSRAFFQETGAIFSSESDDDRIIQIFENSIAETTNIPIYYINFIKNQQNCNLESTFLPDTRAGRGIFRRGEKVDSISTTSSDNPEAVTVLYVKEDGKFKRIASSKVYIIGTAEVYETDDNGIVQ